MSEHITWAKILFALGIVLLFSSSISLTFGLMTFELWLQSSKSDRIQFIISIVALVFWLLLGAVGTACQIVQVMSS